MPSPLQVSRTLPNALPKSSEANRLLSNQSFVIDETTSKKTAAVERRIQSLEDKLKASNIKAKKVNGDGTNSILRKGTPIAEKSNAHENSNTKKRTPKKSSKSGSPNHDANNNGSARGKGKKNGKGRKVSFDGKKAASRTNLPK